jgi:hypothetical protein
LVLGRFGRLRPGVDLAATVHDRLGRPLRLIEGKAIEALYSGSA